MIRSFRALPRYLRDLAAFRKGYKGRIEFLRCFTAGTKSVEARRTSTSGHEPIVRKDRDLFTIWPSAPSPTGVVKRALPPRSWTMPAASGRRIPRHRCKSECLECELLDRRRFRTQAEAKLAIFKFVEAGTIGIADTRPAATNPRSSTK